MSILLAALLLISSLGVNHFFLKAAGTGVHLRAAIISALYERALRLTGRARIEHTNSKLVNHISVDGELRRGAACNAALICTHAFQ
jgi:hypothetical protein